MKNFYFLVVQLNGRVANRCSLLNLMAVAILAALFLVSQTVSGQTCTGQPNSHLITAYGAFTPNSSTASTIATNNATINGAIVTLGQAGGGILLIPAGTFYIGPNPALADRAVTIAYDNITICGAGKTQTILKTNGTWNVANARRGHGIIIAGTSTYSSPRKNIVLKDFELDGQGPGWTGDYSFPANAQTGAGWDIMHKGIVASWDNYVDNVTLENLYVHNYQGEILYCGGFGLGKLTVTNVKMAQTNGSDFNLYASDLQVQNCEFGGPSRFWIEYATRQSSNSNQTNKAVFKNNTFHDAKYDGAGIVLTQGDYNTVAVTFDGNTISNGYSVFGMYGGVGGPVSIVNNTISNCTQKILSTASVAGWINSGNNKNVTMENNTITGAGYLTYFAGVAENFVIRNNTYSGGFSVVYAAGPLVSNVVDGNRISNSRTPEEEWGWAFNGTRPLFQNNIYTNCEARANQGTYNITTSAPLVTPHCEKVIVYGNTANIVARLAINGYPNGQITTITGGSASLPVRFATGQASYTVSADRYLTGSNSLTFTFNSTQGKWIEGGGSAVAPTVTTTAISAITQTTASSGGNVTSDGGASVTARGVCWSTSANPTTANSKTTNGTGTGTYTSAITGLTASTTYHVRAYATNSVGTSYGSDVQFTTSSGSAVAPTVTTTAISAITQTTASSGGNVTSDGGASVTARGVCWSTSANPTTANSKTTNGTGTGTYTSAITGLTASTTYHVRAYATNSVGTSYGSDVQFTTLAGGGASLSGSVAVNDNSVNLTTLGTNDWKHFRNNDHQASGTMINSISNFSTVGGTATNYAAALRSFSWTGGTPTASSTNNITGVYIAGIGKGFSFTVVAGNGTNTVYVYVGGYYSGGTLRAHLSNSAAADYVNTISPTTQSGDFNATYTINYNAAATGQTLTITWIQASGNGNVAIQAAALVGTTKSALVSNEEINIAPDNNGSDIIIYPNPASTEVNILLSSNTANAEVSLVDMYGKTLKTMSSNSGNKINLQLNDLSSGIYFVKVKQGNLNIVRKVVITK